MVNILLVAGLILGAVAVPVLIFLLVLYVRRTLWCAKARIYLGARWLRLVCRFRGHESDSRYIHPALDCGSAGPQHLFPCHRCGRVDYDAAEQQCKLWFAQRGVYFTGQVLSPDMVRRML